MSFLPVGDYGVIGDLHTAALVGRNGSIDWLCAPRFDSPSVFAALLDQVRGGRWCIAPTVPATTEHRYLPGTNILVTTFRIESGGDRKSTRLNSSHSQISYAVFCLKKK